MDSIKLKRLNQLQTTNNRTSSLWKPQPGKTQIRIVPYEFNKDNPFIELFFHYNLNNRSYLSPISFGRPDPIEEFAQKLKASGNKEDYQLSKKLEAKMRTFAPVIVRGEESQGVKFWGFGKTVYQELLSIIADPDYGDITDPVNGRDVVVEFISAEESGASFPTTKIRVKPNQTPISDEPEILEKVKEQQDIREIVVVGAVGPALRLQAQTRIGSVGPAFEARHGNVDHVAIVKLKARFRRPQFHAAVA